MSSRPWVTSVTLLLALCAFCAPLAAQEATAPEATTPDVESKLQYQNGTIALKGDMAMINLPPGFRFLDAANARILLTEGWGNPASAADAVLGMIVPSAVSPLAESGWAVVVEYIDDGYVSDKDAAKIDFNRLLADMQKGAEKHNKDLEKQGYPTVKMVGWAEPPTYNAETHKLYWAKELDFSNNPEHELNYCVRLLGRRGVLELNAVAAMSLLPTIRSDMQQVLGFVDFNPGHQYTDYVAGSDKRAAYGVAALVAGGVLAKTGIFKMLLLGLLAAKKFLVVGALAAVAFVRKLFAGRSKDPSAPIG